jgi:hypothetical protein
MKIKKELKPTTDAALNNSRNLKMPYHSSSVKNKTAISQINRCQIYHNNLNTERSTSKRSTKVRIRKLSSAFDK